jgi:hypothetical protein
MLMIVVEVLGSTQQQALVDMRQEQYNDIPMVEEVPGDERGDSEEWIDVHEDEAFARALEETATSR